MRVRTCSRCVCVIIAAASLSCLCEATASLEKVTRRDEPLTRVTLQLLWRHQFQFAGYYMAKEKGFYREAGLDVEFRERRAGVHSIDEVISGQADFGVSNDLLVQRALHGAPVVVLAALQQRSPTVVLATRRSGINTIKDLAGKRIVVANNQIEGVARQLLLSQGIADHDVLKMPHDYTLTALIEGRADACIGYLSDEPYTLRKLGIDYVSFQPREYGVDAYGDLLFTSRRKAQDDPEQVIAFREASLRGWEYAIEHVEEAIDHILAVYAPDADREKLVFEAIRLRGLMATDLVTLGHVNGTRWSRIVRQTAALEGFPESALPVNGENHLLFEQYMAYRWQYGRLLLVLSAVILVLGTLFWCVVSWTLNRMVRRRTAELTEANAQLNQENEMRRLAAESLRQSEALFKTLAEGIFDGLSMVDANGCLIYTNARFEAMYGYGAGTLIGKPFECLLSPGYAGRELMRFGKWSRTGTGGTDRIEAVLRRKDGKDVPVEISVQDVRVQGERALVAIHRDISERKQMLRDMVRIVEWERRRIGQDLHDTIGQELTGIAYLAGSLCGESELPRCEREKIVADVLEICRDTHRQLRGIVSGLLPLSADETLSEGLRRLTCNIRERLSVACELCERSGAPVEDIHTASHLFQIAQEATANAVRHGGATAIRITLETDGLQGELVIDDNGCGFDPANVGTGGSGLKIMRSRAELIGGNLLFVKREDGGMSVRCRFGDRMDKQETA